MERLLLGLSLQSQTSAQRLDTAGHTHAQGRAPTGAFMDDKPPQEYLRSVYERAGEDSERERVIAMAERELESVRRKEAPDEGEGPSLADLILEDGEGYSAEQVAAHFYTSPSLVRGVRKRADRNPVDGRSLDGNKPLASVAERRAEARRLRDQENLSVRQIAAILKVSTFTISTDLKATQVST